MKVLITGGSGALGRSLVKIFNEAYAPTHDEMDITDPDSVEKAIMEFKPDILIHAAALVGSGKCDVNTNNCWKINIDGTQNIVNSLKKLDNNCYLIYLSTACVFAGEKEKFYTEDDIPAPKSFYGITKLGGEIVTRQYDNTCIIRTNFAPKEQWKYPKAFTDRFGTYLFTDNVAKGISEVIEKKEKGIIHIVGDKRISMYDLAMLAGSKNVEKMTQDTYDGPPITVDMSLSTKRWKKYKIQ